MADTPASYPLRALSIGEIFDRAVTIFVRNFVVFTAMVFTLLAPYAVVQYFFIPADQNSFASILAQMQHPTTSQTQAQVSMAPGALAALIFFTMIFLLLVPFVNNAVAVGVAELYNGRAPQYGASFKAVLRRSLPLFGTALLSGLIIGAVYMGVLMALVIVVVIGVALVKVLLPLAIVMFVLAAIGVLALIVVLMMLLLVYAFATYATSLEGASVTEAIASAFRRVLNRHEFRKALLMALAYLALQLGVLMVSSTVTVLVSLLLKNYAVQLAVTAIFSAVLTAFLTILVAVYYYDVRTRSEGLDLEVDLGRLTAAS